MQGKLSIIAINFRQKIIRHSGSLCCACYKFKEVTFRTLRYNVPQSIFMCIIFSWVEDLKKTENVTRLDR